jgi:hypothetical protein
MHTLENLTIIWIGVLAAHFMARATRLTPVLFYLFMGAIYVCCAPLMVNSPYNLLSTPNKKFTLFWPFVKFVWLTKFVNYV